MSVEKKDFRYTELDKEIINSVIYEKSNRQIAEKTGYSESMIKYRLSAIFRHLGVRSKVGLVREVCKHRKAIFS